MQTVSVEKYMATTQFPTYDDFGNLTRFFAAFCSKIMLMFLESFPMGENAPCDYGLNDPDVSYFCDNLDTICSTSSSRCGAEIDGINECSCPISNEVKSVKYNCFIKL